MISLRNLFRKHVSGLRVSAEEKKGSKKSMGKKARESLKLFGSHAAPTGWGYLSGGMF